MADPPYSSGKMTPRMPISPSSAKTSCGKVHSASHLRTWGRIFFSAKERIVSRRTFCSWVNSNSTATSLELECRV